MKPHLFERLFGPSWRSSLSGIATAIFGGLTALSSLPYTIGSMGLIIPAWLKEPMAATCGTAAVICKIWNALVTKDKVVSGTPATGQIVGTPGDKPRLAEPAVPPDPPKSL